jgi:hypothetical protein
VRNQPARHNPAVGIAIVERALEKAVLHRKDSLFYKTRNGAQMGVWTKPLRGTA